MISKEQDQLLQLFFAVYMANSHYLLKVDAEYFNRILTWDNKLERYLNNIFLDPGNEMNDLKIPYVEIYERTEGYGLPKNYEEFVELIKSLGREATPLTFAARCIYWSGITTLEVLIRKGADINIADGKGQTALIALLDAFIDPAEETDVTLEESIRVPAYVVKFLLTQPGIKVDHPDNQGRTALTYAKNNGYMVSLRYLQGFTPEPLQIAQDTAFILFRV